MTGRTVSATSSVPEGQVAAGILAFSGSSGRGSLNSQLLDAAVEAMAALDADVSRLDLRDLELPLYDPDMEPGEWPQGVRVFRQLLSAHDGLIIAAPEYNGSLPPLLKNALDWSAMASGSSSSLAPYHGKVAAIMSATASEIPSAYCLNHLRTVLSTMGVFVLPDEISVVSAEKRLHDSVVTGLLRCQMAALVGELRSPRIWIDVS